MKKLLKNSRTVVTLHRRFMDLKNENIVTNFIKTTDRGVRERIKTVYNANFQKNIPEHYCGSPYVSALEINKNCNLDCIMCNTKMSKRKQQNMSLDLFEKALFYMHHNHLTITTLHTINEPLINPQLEEYLKLLIKYKIRVMLSTNVQVLDRKLDLLFKYSKAIHQIRFSVDGATKEIYEKIRRPGKFDKLIENLELFKKENSQRKTFKNIRMNSIICGDTKDQIAYHLKVFSDYVDIRTIDMDIVNGLSPDNSFFFDQCILKNHIVLNQPCNQLSDTVDILCDGSVSACCRDYHGDLIYGNYNDSDLPSIINNNKIVELRKAHNTFNVDPKSLCASCYQIDPQVTSLFKLFFSYLIRKHHRNWDVDLMQNKFDDFFKLFEESLPSEHEFVKLFNFK